MVTSFHITLAYGSCSLFAESRMLCRRLCRALRCLLTSCDVQSEVAGEPKHVSGTSHQICLANRGLQRPKRCIQPSIHVMQPCTCVYHVRRIGIALLLALLHNSWSSVRVHCWQFLARLAVWSRNLAASCPQTSSLEMCSISTTCPLNRYVR